MQSAAFDGAFVAHQSHGRVTIAELLEHLPAALVAVRRELRPAVKDRENSPLATMGIPHFVGGR